MGFIQPVLPVHHHVAVIVLLDHGFGNGGIDRRIGPQDGQAHAATIDREGQANAQRAPPWLPIVRAGVHRASFATRPTGPPGTACGTTGEDSCAPVAARAVLPPAGGALTAPCVPSPTHTARFARGHRTGFPAALRSPAPRQTHGSYAQSGAGSPRPGRRPAPPPPPLR